MHRFVLANMAEKGLVKEVWKRLEQSSPQHIFTHAVAGEAWKKDKKQCKSYWNLCVDIARWQDQRGWYVTILAPSSSAFWASKASRPLRWMTGMHDASCWFQDGTARCPAWIVSNLAEGTFERIVDSVSYFEHDLRCYNPQFVVELAACLSLFSES